MQVSLEELDCFYLLELIDLGFHFSNAFYWLITHCWSVRSWNYGCLSSLLLAVALHLEFCQCALFQLNKLKQAWNHIVIVGVCISYLTFPSAIVVPEYFQFSSTWSEQSIHSCRIRLNSFSRETHKSGLREELKKHSVYDVLEGRWCRDIRLWIQEKVLLGYNSSHSIYGHHRKAHLQHPGVHDVIDSVRKLSVISNDSLWNQSKKQNRILTTHSVVEYTGDLFELNVHRKKKHAIWRCSHRSV